MNIDTHNLLVSFDNTNLDTHYCFVHLIIAYSHLLPTLLPLYTLSIYLYISIQCPFDNKILFRLHTQPMVNSIYARMIGARF